MLPVKGYQQWGFSEHFCLMMDLELRIFYFYGLLGICIIQKLVSESGIV